MKKIILMLVILFVCGFVSSDISLTTLQEEGILLNLERFTSYAYNKTLFKDVFWSILYERSKLFGLIFLMIFTPIRDKLSIFLLGIFSFIWGFFFMSCISQLGMVGVVVGIFSVFPHGLLYLFVFIILFHKRGAKRYIEKERMGKNIVTYILMVMIFITGCVLETVVGTQFVPWIIRLSLV